VRKLASAFLQEACFGILVTQQAGLLAARAEPRFSTPGLAPVPVGFNPPSTEFLQFSAVHAFRSEEECEMERTNWHHGPEHRFQPGQIFIVTGATLYKRDVFYDAVRLNCLQQTAFDFTKQGGWRLISWSFFSNHYHMIAKSHSDSLTLSRLVQGFHSKSAREVNRLDSKPGRRVWYEYWDRCLTIQSSYYARLNYVNNNPVRHGLVSVASQYPFCSAGLYEMKASPAFQRRLSSYNYGRVCEVDDFEPTHISI